MKTIDPANFEYCHEKQKKIVNSDAFHIMVNGCAGCRKTQTLVFRAIREAQHKSKNVMILTFVGSVTAEIMDRIEREINIKFFRRGNHFFLTFPQGNTLEVANYDAMIHKQLSASGDPIVHYSGDWFSEKIRKLLKKIESRAWKDLIMVNGAKADYLLVDEFQDMEETQVRVLGEILKVNPKIQSMVLGDYLQSIFHVGNDDIMHAMDYWRETIRPVYYQMEICFRCPPSHILLSNVLLEEERKKRLIPNMRYPSWINYGSRKNIRPIAFTHPPLSCADVQERKGNKIHRNTTARIVADQVVESLKVLKGFDPFKPEDVCIIMSKVNDNAVFVQLRSALDRFYKRIGWPAGSVIHFETRGGTDKERQSINWDNAKGKTVLASIHGIKGKGFPIVFFLGLTEGSLPQNNRLFKPEQLLDHSLLNVALTRSTKWLFVAFAGGKPSRYLFEKWRFFLEVCSQSWNPRTQKNMEEKLLGKALFHPKFWVLDRNYWRHPYLNGKNYQKEKIERPNKFINSVKDDILSYFGHPKDLESHWADGTKVVFGESQIIEPFPEIEMNFIWGTMANLLLMREYAIRIKNTALMEQNFGFFVEPWKTVYLNPENPEDDIFLTLVHDLDLNMNVKNHLIDLSIFRDKLTEAHHEYERYIKGHSRLEEIFELARNLKEPKIFLPTFLKKEKFQQAVMEFMDLTRDLERVSPNTAWDISVAYSFISGEIRRPRLAHYFGYAKDFNLCQLYQNVKAFVELRIDQLDAWKFESSHSLGGLECRSEILDRMGCSNIVEYGLKGRSDVINLRESVIYEIKNSIKDGFNNLWASQILCYHCLPLMANIKEQILPKWKTLEIVDLRQGVMWIKKVDYNSEENKLRRGLIVKKITERIGYLEEHQKIMIAKVLALD